MQWVYRITEKTNKAQSGREKKVLMWDVIWAKKEREKTGNMVNKHVGYSLCTRCIVPYPRKREIRKWKFQSHASNSQSLKKMKPEADCFWWYSIAQAEGGDKERNPVHIRESVTASGLKAPQMAKPCLFKAGVAPAPNLIRAAARTLRSRQMIEALPKVWSVESSEWSWN